MRNITYQRYFPCRDKMKGNNRITIIFRFRLVCSISTNNEYECIVLFNYKSMIFVLFFFPIYDVDLQSSKTHFSDAHRDENMINPRIIQWIELQIEFLIYNTVNSQTLTVGFFFSINLNYVIWRWLKLWSIRFSFTYNGEINQHFWKYSQVIYKQYCFYRQ